MAIMLGVHIGGTHNDFIGHDVDRGSTEAWKAASAAGNPVRSMPGGRHGHHGNCLFNPNEVFESRFPLRVEDCAMDTDCGREAGS